MMGKTKDKDNEIWDAVPPPTGDEQPQKYYGSAYLPEVEALKQKARAAAAMGEELDVSDENPLTVAAVAPHLLKKSDLAQVEKNIPLNTTADGYQTIPDQTHVEANGDEEWRVKAQQDDSNDNRMDARPVSSDEDAAGRKDEGVPAAGPNAGPDVATTDKEAEQDGKIANPAPVIKSSSGESKSSPAKKSASKKTTSGKKPVKLGKKK